MNDGTDNTDVYVLITEDRHADVDVQVFRTEQAARDEMTKWRESLIQWRGEDEWEELELSDEMIKSGRLVNVSYSPERDYVRIQRVTLR